jgi:hypothetical protein
LVSSGSTIKAQSNIQVVISPFNLPIDPGQYTITLYTKTQDNYSIDMGTVLLKITERALSYS